MAKAEKKPLHYIWIPGQGPTEDALARLLALVPERPDEAPGEAWFIGEKRKFYDSFISMPVEVIPGPDLEHFFADITGGIANFAEMDAQVRIWTTWIKYLTPRLIDRACREYTHPVLLESLFTAFFRIFTTCGADQTDELRRDILDTLGRLIMRPDLFDENGESLCAHFWDWKVAPGTIWPRCNGPISASLFLCLTYLPLSEIETWAGSVLAIESIYFRANLLAWLAGAFEPLTKSPNPFLAISKSSINLTWTESFLLESHSPVIPTENIALFFRTTREILTFEKLLDWVQDMEKYPSMASALKVARTVDYVADTVLIG